jgi:hypothetical protein
MLSSGNEENSYSVPSLNLSDVLPFLYPAKDYVPFNHTVYP